MNELKTKNLLVLPNKEDLFNFLSHLSPKMLLFTGGIVSAVFVACVAIVCSTGSEMTISKNGFSINQPVTSA